jgi:hypothetical protein
MTVATLSALLVWIQSVLTCTVFVAGVLIVVAGVLIVLRWALR